MSRLQTFNISCSKVVTSPSEVDRSCPHQSEHLQAQSGRPVLAWKVRVTILFGSHMISINSGLLYQFLKHPGNQILNLGVQNP